MLLAVAEAILGVDEELLNTCRQFFQEIWNNARALSIVTTTKGTGQLHEHATNALSTLS